MGRACSSLPFSEYISHTQTSTQYLTRSSVMAGDTYNLISQLQVQASDARRDLWDFGSYPERKDDGLLFEKEVLDIQVGKASKCFVSDSKKCKKDFKLYKQI